MREAQNEHHHHSETVVSYQSPNSYQVAQPYVAYSDSSAPSYQAGQPYQPSQAYPAPPTQPAYVQ